MFFGIGFLVVPVTSTLLVWFCAAFDPGVIL
jgi:hypothetical protein